MKHFLAALLLFLSMPFLHADNLLSNGDFTDGANHWQGDGSPGSPSGLSVTLKATDWTKVYQDVTLPGNQATVKIAYTILTETAFSSTLQGVQQGPDLGKLLGFLLAPSAIMVRPASWLIFLVDDAQHLASYVNVPPQFGTTQLQTTGGTIPNLKGSPSKTIYLVFPPGEGTVTLQSVSVTTP